MKKIAQAAGLAAALALAAGGALAQAGAAGTTGVTTGSTAGGTTTATRIAPADGSNGAQVAGGMSASQGGAPVVQSNIYGAAVVQANQNTRVEGNSTITTTQYWANVPSNVQTDDRFQRWQRLK